MPRSVPCRAFLLSALALALAVPAAADSSLANRANAAPSGFHDVKTGGAVVRVADQGGAHFRGSEATAADNQYDPQNANFGRTSSYANKSFDVGAAALSQNDTAEEARDNKQFLTHGYSTRGYNQADRVFQTAAYDDTAHPDAELSKSFTLPKAAALGADSTFNADKKSEFQDKTALIAQAAPKIDPFSTPDAMSEKTFCDPALTKVKRDPYAAANGLDVSRLSALPNRSLTVDEVRDLINHDQVPDLTSKPDAPSRPLNDPDWTPPTAAPLAPDDRPVKPGPTTEDKSDDLPSPGMMAQPGPGAPAR